MDSSRTRFLLRALRPNGADDADPTFQSALERMHAEPELTAWFEHERAVDRALAGKLREVRPPADLRAQILQGLALSAAPRTRRPFALALAALAAAASIALVIYTLWPTARRGTVPFDLMVTAAVRETATAPALEFTSDAAGEIRSWIEAQQAPPPRELPGGLAALQPRGGAIVEWQGVRCSLVTFDAPVLADGAAEDASTATVVHLYTVPRRSCSSEGVGIDPRVAVRDRATIATWRDAENYYVFVAHAPPARVQELLGPTATLAWNGRVLPPPEV